MVLMLSLDLLLEQLPQVFLGKLKGQVAVLPVPMLDHLVQLPLDYLNGEQPDIVSLEVLMRWNLMCGQTWKCPHWNVQLAWHWMHWK